MYAYVFKVHIYNKIKNKTKDGKRYIVMTNSKHYSG